MKSTARPTSIAASEKTPAPQVDSPGRAVDGVEEAISLIEKDTARAPFKDMPEMLFTVAKERGLDWPGS